MRSAEFEERRDPNTKLAMRPMTTVSIWQRELVMRQERTEGTSPMNHDEANNQPTCQIKANVRNTRTYQQQIAPHGTGEASVVWTAFVSGQNEDFVP